MCVRVHAPLCDLLAAAQLIAPAALLREARESCPEIPWRGVPESFHSSGDTHTHVRERKHTRAHKAVQNKFKLYVERIKIEVQTIKCKDNQFRTLRYSDAQE